MKVSQMNPCRLLHVLPVVEHNCNHQITIWLKNGLIAPLENTFSDTCHLFEAVKTFGCSTAIYESSFSSLNRIAVPQWISMRCDRMKNLTFYHLKRNSYKISITWKFWKHLIQEKIAVFNYSSDLWIDSIAIFKWIIKCISSWFYFWFLDVE